METNNEIVAQQEMSEKIIIACLFDLDGTVLDSRKCGTKAIDLALRELYGWKNMLPGVRIAGRTDLRIFADIYSKIHGRLPDKEAWDNEVEQFKVCYLDHLKRQLETRTPHVHPGFPELFDSVCGATGLEPGLATGNFRRGAELKLEAAGIDPSRFPYGSFGCETHDRSSLLQYGRERAEKLAGQSVRVVVIGDTPEDFKAARNIDAFCALVSTGPYAHEELKPLEPDFLAENFSDPSPFMTWLASLRTL